MGSALTGPVVRGLADYRILAGAKVRSDWQYRTSFVVFIVTNLVINVADFVGIAVLFTRTDRLGGWSLDQVAFLYGSAAVCFGLADMLVGSVESISPRIRDGSFDQLLIRPVNTLVNLTATDFSFRRIGKIAQGLTIFVIAVARNDIDWTAGRALMVATMIVTGTIIAGATWIISSSVAFWTVNTQEIANTFTYGGGTTVSYPLHLFEQWLRVLLTYVIPLVFVNYLPALYVLDIETPLALPDGLRWASPAAAGLVAMVANRVWRSGLRRYHSTGS